MDSIYNETYEDLKAKYGFRATQIYSWLYQKYALDFECMNINKELKLELSEKFCISCISPVEIKKSIDGTKKYLFKTQDNLSFESVFLKMKEKKKNAEGIIIESEKYTFCVSSQVGCKMNCSFCFTAKGGFIRNLKASEIVEQVVALKRDNEIEAFKSVNIVFMGMGEPLDNLKEVVRAINIISSKFGLSISPKRITISTSGVASKIKELSELDLGVRLALSLHAVDDELRSQLMPLNKVYNIKTVLDSIKSFKLDKRSRILFEYLIIKDVNDDLKSAAKLVKLLNPFKAKVNLIPFNPHEGSPYEAPSMERITKFSDFLYSKGLLATVRKSRGQDIDAACGQLREKYLAKQD
ncbi:23S rRNA (adenine(2503)-C(2))-methyltransferase RlmN [Helicobacter sp. 11S02629-2]|uniref:23S rRNA (adenine(2503)-C(2))-methyltransferase RlmN n=1 Tax=Helicobacter sp. 11S02629-2 TaxID=1476195 RepID=UPI000BA573FD|nr:23S rRNA (adenine(2503)-C(2))-methyltransferase RlmN [Helicobacter sp. 11S02629-2]PAF45627.1 23S rRNA (adenine(2503)-C(2))-methyltransferase [Helicobacter sp. 11S02629-2]